MPILLNNGVTKITKTFDLRSPEAIAKDNGTITGALTFTREGADFDGTNDMVTYAVPATFFQSKPKISIIIEFTPDFAYDDNNNRFLCDSTNGARYLIYKRNNAGVNKLAIYLGNTALTEIASSAYSDYWRNGKRNVLVVSGTTGANNAWLNGTQIMTSEATAWSTATPTEFFVGAAYNGAGKFDGRIHSVAIKNGLTTAQEALDLYDNSTFNFENAADVWLDMASQSSDGTNQITLDKSGNGKDFRLGDGTTSANFPSFSNPGFNFDGTNDYMLNSSASGVLNNTYQTFVLCFKPDFNYDYNDIVYFYDTSASETYALIKSNNASSNVLQVYLGDTLVGNIVEATYSPYWRTHGLNVFVVTGTTGNTDVYLNNVKIMDADNTAWTPDDATQMILGTYWGFNGYFFDGEIFHFSSYGSKFAQKMTPTQVRALTSQLFNQYS